MESQRSGGVNVNATPSAALAGLASCYHCGQRNTSYTYAQLWKF